MKLTMLAGLMAAAIAVPIWAQEKPKGPAPKTKPEADAVMALFSAQSDPDATIKSAEELLTKFKDTDFKDTALYMEARAYQAKGDNDRAQVFAEKALEANPKNFQASLMLGESIAQRVRENDLNKEEELTKSEKYLNQTIETLKTAEKPNPQLSDEQWDTAKKQLSAEAQSGLGICALDRKKYDDAVNDFKAAADADPQEPTYHVRLASAYLQNHKYDEAMASADKALGMPNLDPRIKSAAMSVKSDAMKAKGGGKL